MKWIAIYLTSAMVGSVAASASAFAQMGDPAADPSRPYPYDYSFNDTDPGGYEQGYGYGHGYPDDCGGSGYGHPYDYASPSGLEGEVTAPLVTGRDR